MNRALVAFSVVALAALACQTPALTEAPSLPTMLPAASPPDTSLGTGLSPDARQDLLVSLYDSASQGTVAILTDTGQGSGFVFDSQGHIITNYHVVEGSTRVEVDFISGYKTYGRVIGTDLDSDLAVVQVEAPAGELHPVPLGDSESLRVGQTVVAIGNPFGLNGTMTVGIISALGRTLDSIHETADGTFFTAGDIIQTDAAINPGNSGGPLFNLDGEVVGVNRAIRTTNFNESGDAVNSGIGFAVSINVVRRVVPVLIAEGEYVYPYLGISSRDNLSLEVINTLGLKSFTGAYVADVTDGGPADKAGIQAGTEATEIPNLNSGGDLITAVDGRTVRQFDDLLSYLITNKGPGDSVILTVQRGGEVLDIEVILGKRP
jgi:2-alkenal reductase